MSPFFCNGLCVSHLVVRVPGRVFTPWRGLRGWPVHVDRAGLEAGLEDRHVEVGRAGLMTISDLVSLDQVGGGRPQASRWPGNRFSSIRPLMLPFPPDALMILSALAGVRLTMQMSPKTSLWTRPWAATLGHGARPMIITFFLHTFLLKTSRQMVPEILVGEPAGDVPATSSRRITRAGVRRPLNQFVLTMV